ncbi:MAG: SDR family NAD(P)-dependent oxidoreductase [Alphaproteobacteria bacterium]|nr:SDR family NAD(P)-dependent oxidoreductase [Alphaproteobacteria bacterium]
MPQPTPQHNDRHWQGRRVWITGGTSGIGWALADALARRGARLALTARSADAIAAAVAGLPGSGHLALPADIADPAALDRALALLRESWGGLDLAILNAGTYVPMRGDAIDLPAAHRLVDVNLKGTISAAAAAIALFLAAGRGHLAVVASVAGYVGLPKALVYGATKAALINFTEALHIDLAGRGIKVQLVCPGFVATPLTDGNDFRMPALLTAEDAAARIVAGLTSRRFEIHFPKRFTLGLKLMRLLPYPVAFRLIHRATGL